MTTTATPARIATLIDWAVSNGAVLHPDIQVYQDPSTGFSFQVKPTAGKPLPGNYSEPIVRLPASLSLSYLNAISTEGPGSPLSDAILNSSATSERLPPHVIGRLFLIKEYLAGESSFWHPYIQTLPQPSDLASWVLPPFWDDDDAELLEGTNVEVGLAKIRADLKGELATLHTILLASVSSTDGLRDESNDRLVENFRPDLYHWAYAVFSSRSFRPSLVLSPEQCRVLPAGVNTDDFSVLLPLFDIGNHDMTAPIRWERYGGSGGGGLAGGCELQVGRGHQPGEQVFNNYSFKTNAELLLGYGFLIPPTAALHNDYIHVRKKNAGDVVAATSEEYLISARPLRDDSSVLARAKLPAVAGFAVDQAVHIAPAFQHVQPDMVWDIFASIAPADVRAQLIPLPEEHDLTDAAGAERQRQVLFLTGQISGECLAYYAQTAAIIQHKVMQELERLNETDFDVDDDDRQRLTPNQKLALEYRDRCRVVLESTLKMMNDDETLAAAMGDEEWNNSILLEMRK